MSETQARQYQCNLCGKLELSDDGSLPLEWRANKNERLAACGSCVAAVLRDSVDALVGNVSAACRGSLGHIGEPDSYRMVVSVQALMIAYGMLQREIFRLVEEMRRAAERESDAMRAAEACEQAGE